MPQTMTKWVCQAVLDSFTVFFLPMAAYKDATTVWAERGYGEGLFVFGTTVYAGLIMAMMMKVFNMTNVRSRLQFARYYSVPLGNFAPTCMY